MFSYLYINVIFIEFIYNYYLYYYILLVCNKIMHSANIKSIL